MWNAPDPPPAEETKWLYKFFKGVKIIEWWGSFLFKLTRLYKMLPCGELFMFRLRPGIFLMYGYWRFFLSFIISTIFLCVHVCCSNLFSAIAFDFISVVHFMSWIIFITYSFFHLAKFNLVTCVLRLRWGDSTLQSWSY